MEEIHRKAQADLPVSYVHTPRPEDNDAVLGSLPPGSLVANATGLGKDAPGSPITGSVPFPMRGYAWDFNYRGDLLFQQQAKQQETARSLTVAGGWLYFIYGWLAVISEVFHRPIPFQGPMFEDLCRIAAKEKGKE